MFVKKATSVDMSISTTPYLQYFLNQTPILTKLSKSDCGLQHKSITYKQIEYNQARMHLSAELFTFLWKSDKYPLIFLYYFKINKKLN